MAWDFAETNVFANAAGDIAISLEGISRTLAQFGPGSKGTPLRNDSQTQSISLHKVISTDPPTTTILVMLTCRISSMSGYAVP